MFIWIYFFCFRLVPLQITHAEKQIGLHHLHLKQDMQEDAVAAEMMCRLKRTKGWPERFRIPRLKADWTDSTPTLDGLGVLNWQNVRLSCPFSYSDSVIPFTKQNSDVILPWYQRREKLTNGAPLNVFSSNDANASGTVGIKLIRPVTYGLQLLQGSLKMHWNTPVLKLHNALYLVVDKLNSLCKHVNNGGGFYRCFLQCLDPVCTFVYALSLPVKAVLCSISP